MAVSLVDLLAALVVRVAVEAVRPVVVEVRLAELRDRVRGGVSRPRCFVVCADVLLAEGFDVVEHCLLFWVHWLSHDAAGVCRSVLCGHLGSTNILEVEGYGAASGTDLESVLDVKIQS